MFLGSLAALLKAGILYTSFVTLGLLLGEAYSDLETLLGF